MAVCSSSNVAGAFQSRVFSSIGQSMMLEAEPAVLHFPMIGPPGRVAKQSLRIRNRAGYSVRMTLAAPMTPFFKVSFASRLGSVAPGMAEEIIVEFFAQELRYYYDCLRVESEDARLVVPIHAYPSVGAVGLPGVVDFGTVSMGGTTTRKIPLRSKLAAQFEYQIVQSRPNPRFSIHPLQGVVSGDAPVEITISFSPTRFATEFSTIQVNLSGFDTEPHECNLIGSCAPGLALKSFLLSQTAQLTASATDRPPDADTEQPPRRDCRIQGPIMAKLPTMPPTSSGRMVDSIFCPPNLSSHASINFVLGQTANKAAATAVQGEDERTLLQGLGATNGVLLPEGSEAVLDGVHMLDCRRISSAAKADIFASLLQEAVDKEQQLLLPSHNMVGQDVLEASGRQAVQEARLQHAAAHQLQQQERAAHRATLEADRNGPVLPTATSSSTGAQPTWQLASANDWRKRRYVLQRFVSAVRKVIYQLRAQARLDQLKRLLCDVGSGRSGGQFAQVVSAHVLSMLRPGVAPGSLYHPDRVHMRQLPLHRPINFPDLEAVQVVEYTDFDVLQSLELQVPLVCQQLGYTPEELPAYTPYVPPSTAAPMSGAAEELRGHPVPCGAVPDLAQIQQMPAALLACPYINLEIGSRPFSMQAQGVPYPSWGTDVEQLIQPRILPFHDSVAHESPLSTSVRVLCRAPCMSDTPAPHRGLFEPGPVPDLMAGPSADDTRPLSSTANTPSSSQLEPRASKPAASGPNQGADPGSQEGGPGVQLPQPLPRTRKIQELDAAQRKSHLAAVQALQDAVDKYNSNLSQPGKYGLQL